MASLIRELLADAQAAEVKGDLARAATLLRRVAELYRDAKNPTRALKMLRHARRLEGKGDDEAAHDAPEPAPEGPGASGGGVEPQAGEPEPAEPQAGEPEPVEPEAPPRRRRPRRELVERAPTLADPALDAWCSFCCRPRAEVGALVAGPAGAYVCSGCVGTAAMLLGTPVPSTLPSPPARLAEPRPGAHAPEPGLVPLPQVERARARLLSASGRATLLLGPEGSGKSALLEALGEVVRVDPEGGASALSRWRAQAAGRERPLLRVDVQGPVGPQAESLLLEALEQGARAVLAVRAAPPQPTIVLRGEAGEEPLYGTEELVGAVGRALPRAVLALVDGVVALPALDVPALRALAAGLVAQREGVQVAPQALQKLAELAHQSGRGAHELVALVRRVPKGRWQGGG